MKIIWKELEEFKDYCVSNYGEIKNKHSGKQKKISPNKKGYMRVHFYVDKKTKTRYVHRLVAQTFIENKENKKTVNHIDGNKKNNCVDNLEWCTCKEQIQHALKMNLIKKGKQSPMYGKKHTQESIKKMKIKRNLNASTFNKPINQYELDGTYIKTWKCINDAIRFYNNKAIQFCCKGRRKTASGYIWKYLESKGE